MQKTPVNHPGDKSLYNIETTATLAADQTEI
jgi:hypothetical protein